MTPVAIIRRLGALAALTATYTAVLIAGDVVWMGRLL